MSEIGNFSHVCDATEEGQARGKFEGEISQEEIEELEKVGSNKSSLFD